MFIKGVATAQVEKPQDLLKVEKDTIITLHVHPDDGPDDFTIEVHVSAVSRHSLLVRIEGVALYGGKRAQVIAQIFAVPGKERDGVAELKTYS